MEEKNVDGQELLDSAACGDVERLRLLLQKGADLRATLSKTYWERHKTALVLACEAGHVEAVVVILDHGGETVKEQLPNAFLAAGRKGQAQVLKVLLERGVDPCVCGGGNVIFRLAASNGLTQVIELLLRDGRVDPSHEQDCAVAYAAYYGQREVLKLLLSDDRVDGSRAIPGARAHVLPVLLEDERCGVLENRELFAKYHWREVLRYDELVRDRTARICAVSWCMKQIGQGWGDLREILEDRMQRQGLDWQ